MKATLKFKLPDEKEELDLALQSERMYGALYKISGLREKLFELGIDSGPLDIVFSEINDVYKEFDIKL